MGETEYFHLTPGTKLPMSQAPDFDLTPEEIRDLQTREYAPFTREELRELKEQARRNLARPVGDPEHPRTAAEVAVILNRLMAGPPTSPEPGER